MTEAPQFTPQQLDEIRARTSLSALIGRRVKLRKSGREYQGLCPFHQERTPSFTIVDGKGFYHCFGCGAHGDAIRWLMEAEGLRFVEAVKQLAGDASVSTDRAIAQREGGRGQAPSADRDFVSSQTMARWIWRRAYRAPHLVKSYLRARGVPERMLGPETFADLRFLDHAPISAWPSGQDGPGRGSASAPAIVALARRPGLDEGRIRFRPAGLHVTFLAPDLVHKMERRRRDGSFYPQRKMLGPIGGACVVLDQLDEHGSINAEAPIYGGEGIETVLSGMARAEAPAWAIGIAALSLGNLQGEPVRWKSGALPLFDIRPDPERPALAFPHRGEVVGLIDADMKPIGGPGGKGVLVIERRGGPVVRRPISSAERTQICAELFVKSWRAAGARRATAFRPRMGQDFNDAVRELEGVSG